MRSKLLGFFLIVLAACADDTASESTTGQGGSMTRFAFSDEFLYVVNNQSLLVYRSGDGGFQHLNEVGISFGLETIFARGEYLYLGARDAMYIYSIADRSLPAFVFRYSHVTSCDPVVVQGNRAYVTLRGGTACNAGANALEIIDISKPYDPELVANYPMANPHGLAVLDQYLFLCEGEVGLKVFDITNERAIRLLAHDDSFHAFDVIVRPGLATVTGKDGIFQFAFPDPEQTVRLVGSIEVRREEL